MIKTYILKFLFVQWLICAISLTMASNPSNQNDVFTSINRFITIQSEDRRIYMHHCRRVMDVVLASLEKSSDLFKKMSKGIEFSGSYRDNLKVSKPDEYDINLKMKLPLKSTGVIVAAAPNKPGYVRINIKDLLKAMQTSSGLQEAEKELAKLTDDAGNLLQNKWLSWFEGKLFICKDEIEMNLNTEYILRYTKSGPAHTINVTSRKDLSKFSIDFVIGITFDLANETWRATRQIPISSKHEDNYWISIPKPNKDIPGENNPFWIASYPAQENRIIHDKNRLKDAIRFIKKLRDHQNLQNLKSFYIKNVVMLEVDKRVSSYWNNPIATVVKDMLTAVRDCLDAGKIPSYWNSGNNLIGGFSERQNKDIAAKLSSILVIWTTSMDRERIMKTILTDAEIEELNFNIRGMANLCLARSNTAQQGRLTYDSDDDYSTPYLETTNSETNTYRNAAIIAGVTGAIAAGLYLFTRPSNNRNN
uniref:Uncharacterized protein n=1 Tax=Nyssomyia neivai TaxID=330878 RepID=A0A1L8D8A5_9DIPT